MGITVGILKVLWWVLLVCVSITCVCFMTESIIKIAKPRNKTQRTAYIVSLCSSILCSFVFVWIFYKTHKSLWSSDNANLVTG